MKFSLKAALKFILSRKDKTFINFLSYISILALSIGTAAMIIVLSVYNGLENTLKSIYSDFDADIKIEKKESKYFSDNLISVIRSIENVNVVSGVIENKVIFQNDKKEAVAYLKGVDSSFFKQERIGNKLTEGDFIFKRGKIDYGVFGRGIKYNLGLKAKSDFQNIKVFAINENETLKPNMLQKDFFTVKNIKVSGVFAIENNFDYNYVFSSLEFAQNLFDSKNKISSYEIRIKDEDKAQQTKREIKDKIGESFNVLTSTDQRLGLYKILETEKLVVYLVFGIVLLLSSINIFFLLIMMGVEKKKDIGIMFSFGARRHQIRNIFISQGVLIGLASIIIGSIIGIALTFLQKEFGIITIQMSSSILEAYPVDFMLSDLLIVSIMVLTISIIASVFPGLFSSLKNKIFNINKSIS